MKFLQVSQGKKERQEGKRDKKGEKERQENWNKLKYLFGPKGIMA